MHNRRISTLDRSIGLRLGDYSTLTLIDYFIDIDIDYDVVERSDTWWNRIMDWTDYGSCKYPMWWALLGFEPRSESSVYISCVQLFLSCLFCSILFYIKTLIYSTYIRQHFSFHFPYWNFPLQFHHWEGLMAGYLLQCDRIQLLPHTTMAAFSLF